MSKKSRIFLLGLFIILLVILFPAKVNASTPYDNPAFDGEFYLNNYSDLKNAFGNDYKSAYNHFITFGIKEGRQASLCFDVKYYLNYYGDLSKAYQGNYAEAYNHFMIFGIKEGRKSSPYFDVKYYLNNYADLKKAYKEDYKSGYDHFITFGIKEGRRGSEYFDVQYYLNNNPDLKKAFKTNYKSAYEHYLTFGIKEGRNPSEKVNIKCYLNSYADLKKAFAKNYKDVAEHYYLFGVKEGRKATHTIVEMKAVEATCERTGLTSGKKCQTCGEIMEKQKETPKTDHKTGKVTYKWNGNSATATFECPVCKKNIEAKVEVKSEVTKQPSCYEKGTTTYTATATYKGQNIGTDTKTEEIPATGKHSFGEWNLGTSGVLERQCKTSGCTEKETKEVEQTKVKVEKPTSTPDLNQWGYDHNHVDGKGYELKNEDSKNGKLSGVIAEQKINENVYGADKAKGYYFAITVDLTNEKVQNLASGVKFTPTVKVENGDVNKTLTLENEDDTLTLLVRVDEKNAKNETCESCTCKDSGKVADCKCDKKVKLTIDLDGEKEAYSETTYTIDYCNVTFEKDSKFEIQKELPTSAETQIKQQFETWGFNPDSIEDFETYKNGLKIEKVENDAHTVKVTGLLPLMKMNNKDAFGEEATKKDGYYFVYVIKTEKSVGKTTSSGDTYGSVEVKVPQNGEDGMNPTKILNKDAFDTDNEMAVLMQIDPNKADKKFKVVVDMDGSGTGCAPYEITVDYSELKFQKQTTAEIKVEGDGKDVPQADKDLLTEWGYKFPDNIELSEENEEHKNEKLSYNAETGELTGTIKEQKLTNGFDDDELDSYFYTFTIKPEKVTDDIKVTIEGGITDTQTYDKSDFSDGVLTILEHIPTSFTKCDGGACCDENGKCTNIKECSKVVKIKIDSDGESGHDYTESEVYYIDYCNVDFVNLHTVTFKDNSGKTLSIEDVYDNEKAKAPDNPSTNLHFNTFDYWAEDEADETSGKKKFDFNNEIITEDIELTPIWSVDVDEYIQGSLDVINAKENVKDNFQINFDNNTLTVEILNNDTTLSNITDTAIAPAIARALYSGEVDAIDVKLNNKEISLNKQTISAEDEAEIKSEVEIKIKEELKNVFDNQEYGNKTLKELCDECSLENSLEVSLDENIAHPKGKGSMSVERYTIEFERKYDVTLDPGSQGAVIKEKVKKGESKKLPDPEINKEEKDYRTFEGWYNESQKVENTASVTEDMELKAHYTLDVDKFIEDVVKDLNSSDVTHSNDFTGQLNLTQDGNNITINVEKPNIPLSTLAETSIPGTIAYVLEKGEIKDITLDFEEETKEFTKDSVIAKSSMENELKDKVIEDAKDLFNSKLNQKEADATLDQLEYEGKSFTIKIGDVDDTVKLINSSKEEIKQDAEKTYTFSFNSDFAVVNATPESQLGAKKIEDVITEDKDYKKVYINSDISINNTITIDKNITIESLEEDASEIALASEEANTITVTGNKDCVIDVQSGNVTISGLKLTGGKKSELKVEEGAIVTVNDIDVSGIEKVSEEESSNFNAGIIVNGGNLTASNLVNSDESYDVPTIRIPKESVSNVTVTDNSTSKMTRINNYRKVKQISGDNDEVDYINDACYYLKKENSVVYCVTFMDVLNRNNGHVFTLIKWYFHNEHIDTEEIKTYRENFENKNEEELAKYDFAGWFTKYYELGLAPDDGGISNFEDIPVSNITYYAGYKKKPAATVSVQNIDNLKTEGNSVSGILSTQEDDGKYYIPVTLTSDNYVNGKTTVKVTNPNDVTTNYKYNGTETLVKEENQISTMSIADSDSKTVKLNLEAIKSSKITGNNGKVYKIAVDVDGEENDEYEEETYTVNYNNVETLEEIINNAAKNTQNASNLTITKDNNIKGREESFTYKYDREKDVTLYNNDEEYSFRLNKVVTSHNGPIIISVRKSTNEQESRPEINGWKFTNFFTQVSMGSHEISLLQDVMKETTTVEAIEKVKSVEGQEHKYEVTLNKERLNAWLDGAYLDTDKEETTEKSLEANNDSVVVEVTLDNEEKNLVSIKTKENFDIKASNGKTYSGNKIDVKFSDIGSTEIKAPAEFLAKDGVNLTEDDFKKFYEECKKYHKATTGADIYEE